MYWRFSLFLIFLPLFTQLSAQEDSSQAAVVPEPLEVHFNQDFYATGEDIWYKIYVLNDDIKKIKSRIIRVEWLDKNGKIIENQALEITGNYAIGDFKIPYDWQAGLYTFRAYTNWSLNFVETAVFTTSIPIFQVTTQDTVSITPILDTIPNKSIQKGDLSIRFFTKKNNYHRRESVTLIFDVRDNNNQPVRASLSLAVTDDNFLSLSELSAPADFPNYISPATLPYTAEKRFTLTGKLLDTTTPSQINTSALSLYLPQLKRFYRASSQAGTFSWDLPDFYTPTTLQVLNLDPTATTLVPKIVLQKNNLSSPQTIDIQPLKTPIVKKYLHHLYQSRLINEVFELETPAPKFVQQMHSVETIPADKIYSTDGFIKIRDVGEFIDEVILIARVNGSIEKKNRSVLLFNEERKVRFSRPPIYMINGLIATDEKAVLNLPLQEIKELRTYVTTSTINQYFDPLFNANGIVDIITKNGITPDFVTTTPNQVQISGLYNAREFSKNHEVDQDSPILRPTIFWDGKIITNEYGKANVTFPLTDTSGKIWLKIEGISINGQRGKLLQTITVE